MEELPMARKYRHIFRPIVAVTPDGTIEFDFSDSYESAQHTSTFDLLNTPEAEADSESAGALLDAYLKDTFGSTAFDRRPLPVITNPNDLVLERKDQQNETASIGPVMLAPATDEDYWHYRVLLSETQAILGFPKYSTIGIGFAVEEDWNTNLPYRAPAKDIFDHIIHNKGNDAIPDEVVMQAIEMVRQAAADDRDNGVLEELPPL